MVKGSAVVAGTLAFCAFALPHGSVAEDDSQLSFPNFDAPATSEPFSSIVGGVVTAEYPAVGALLLLGDGGGIDDGCTGAFVGCTWFLTMAHCLRHRVASNAEVITPHINLVL